MLRVFFLTLILLFVRLLLQDAVFAQQPVFGNKTFFANNSKKINRWQKTAIILAAGGGLMVVTGWAIPRGKPIERYPDCILECKNTNDDLKSVLVIAGAASLLSSIPLFVISSKIGDGTVYIRPHLNNRITGRHEEKSANPEVVIRIKL